MNFPRLLDSYQDATFTSIVDILLHRIQADPFNLAVTIIFFCAIVHTFMAGKIIKIAHQYEKAHGKESFIAEILHLFGEVEAVFGIWILPLIGVTLYFYDWHSILHYFDQVNYTEPMFVVVIMTLAATKPILYASERCLQMIAKIGGGTPAATWFTILTIGPILGSFITEPGAMTISALLLAREFYDLQPSAKFAYATIGLLFVNISVGGTLSHFAAPPVLMVAGKWNWDLSFMFFNFGWKAFLGILLANILYFIIFKKEFKNMKKAGPHTHDNLDKTPLPVIIINIIFMIWTVYNAHHPALFIGGFLFFLGFVRATAPYQGRINLQPALLVGFFLAGLVTHGGLQGWWIAPILGNLTEYPLMISASILTAFNDNAAITYLSSLVPSFTETLKYAVVAGAVTGGGLTVIANAPNPAGQTILQKYFKNGVSPLKLALSAIVPTIIMGICFMQL